MISKTQSRKSLSTAKARLVETIEQLRFGRIENLIVRGGEPTFDPPPRVSRDIKFGPDHVLNPERAGDFPLKSHFNELFEELERIGDGSVAMLEVRHAVHRHYCGRLQTLDFQRDADKESGHMPAFLLCLVRFVRLLLSGHPAVAIENAALRLQLVAFRRKRKRPVLTAFDRLFWVGLSRVWRGWRGPLHYVQADTVVRWERERFRRFWARVSRVNHRRPGRPATAIEVRRLLERMVAANPLWRG